MRNVPHVHQRTPRSAVAGHLYLPRRPGQASEIIQDEIKTHAGRGSVGGCVAQKGRREIVIRQGRDVSFDECFALGVRRLRIGFRLLVLELARTGAVDAARRGIDESFYSYFQAFFSKRHGPDMVDLVGKFWVVLPEGIVRQLRQMNHGIHAGDIFLGNFSQVFVDARRR